MIERALSVGKAVSNDLGKNINASLLESEYAKVLKSLVEEEPPSELDILPFERYKLPVRLLLVPKPLSVSGWIASFLFYFYLSVTVLTPLILLQFSSYSNQLLENQKTKNEQELLSFNPKFPPMTANAPNPLQQVIANHDAYLEQRHAEEINYLMTVGLINICIGLIIGALSRYWAIQAAKGAIRRKREAYQREKEPIVAD